MEAVYIQKAANYYSPAQQEQRERAVKATRMRVLKALEGAELKLGELDQWCEAHDKPTVAKMADHQRAQLAAWLESGAGATTIKAWFQAQADSEVAVPTVEGK
jgi:hypothetical protein